jgi:hypothetical protein
MSELTEDEILYEYQMATNERPRGNEISRILTVCRAAIAADRAKGRAAVGLDSYVQPVPDHCDRILWRGYVRGLPICQPAIVAADLLGICLNTLDKWRRVA